jgi:hypothetical protein
VRDADIILVLSGGRIAERGSHQELMAARGEYCRLFGLQANGYHTAGDASLPGGPRPPVGVRTPNGRGGAPARMAARE